MGARPSAAAHSPSGLFAALRAVGGTLTEIFRVRGALFALELREELERRKRMVVLAALGFVFLHIALLLLALFVVAVFWDTYRIAAVGAMTVLYLAVGAGALVRLRSEAAASPPPFAATLAELDRDLPGLGTQP